jgi:hypothetical protein
MQETGYRFVREGKRYEKCRDDPKAAQIACGRAMPDAATAGMVLVILINHT